MDNKLLNRIFGAFVFIATIIVYFSTVQPSVSFWDCGEFIASAVSMQVPHPPGTPFFLLIGRLFSMIPFAENIAFRMNLLSVFSSAFTVLFLYLVAVKLIENYKGKEYKSTFDAFITYFSASVGALSLAFSDTFWFNAVEAEVYAASTFFIAFITWLMLVWNERADEKDSEKYLIFIAYLLGLSTGVHLMAVLGSVSIVMTVMFRKYITDEEVLKKSGFIFMGHIALIMAIAFIMWISATDSVAPSPEQFKKVDTRFLTFFGIASVLYMGFFFKKIIVRNSIYWPIIIGGITLVAVYPGIVKLIPNLIASIGGEDLSFDIGVIVILFAVLFYLVYWTGKENKPTANLVTKAFLFAFLGFTTYSSIIIRSNMDTPINLNSPKTFPSLVSYLNREQYGEFPTWKRRFSQEGHQQDIYKNYSSDFDFFLKYQMNHMYHRYLLWNYVGRTSTVQDAGVDFSKFYAIPFLIGLFGIFHQFRKDWKMGTIFMVLFIFLGWLTAFYQNQQQPQPRERDYFYVGAFFVYSIWIAIGTRGIIDLIEEYIKDRTLVKYASVAALAFAFILVPVNMLAKNYWEHDRSRNFVPWDYAYNLLQSAAKDAIIFTNGDNDTFPLWYLQDVEGVRRDVRIANLSLLNTSWYTWQLKNTAPYNSKPVEMDLSNAQLERLQPQRWDTQEISLPLTKEIAEKYEITDPAVLEAGSVSWKMPATLQFGNISAVRGQDIAALSIVRANAWKRPIYFAVTVSEDSQLGLNEYLQMEGLAHRLVPVKADGQLSYIYVNEEILRKQVMEEPEGYSKDYQPGFKFRGLSDSTMFLDNNHTRLTQNYRNSFMRLALHYLNNEKSSTKAVEVLDKMEEKIPHKLIPLDYRLQYDISNMYHDAGAYDRFIEFSSEVIEIAKQRIIDNPRDFGGRYNPYSILIDIYEKREEYQKIIDLLNGLKSLAPNDPSLDMMIKNYQSKLGNKAVEQENPQNN